MPSNVFVKINDIIVLTIKTLIIRFIKLNFSLKNEKPVLMPALNNPIIDTINIVPPRVFILIKFISEISANKTTALIINLIKNPVILFTPIFSNLKT